MAVIAAHMAIPFAHAADAQAWRSDEASATADLPGQERRAQPKGTLFLVGGGPQPAALVQEFVTLAGSAGQARIVVFAMASASGLEGGQSKADQLKGMGASAVNLYINRAEADHDSVVRYLNEATGVWFGGGDQSRLTDVLRGTRAAAAIRAAYERGAVIGGTSAGAAVMSTPMITGDERRRGGDRYPTDSSLIFITIDRGNVVVTDGLGLVTDAIIDQHFVRRKRHNRLISLVLEHRARLGAGIDESTALIIEPDGRWRVSGASVVVVYDARRAQNAPATGPLGASDIVTHVLPSGSRFDPRRGLAMLPGVPSAETTAPIDVQRAAWMVGCWELRRPGFVVQESWSSPLGGAMQGVSRTARNDQFLEAEMLLLRLADGKLGYEAFPTGQRPTRFEATTVSDTLFIFENPAHDFPKLIGYRKVGADSMHAWIEGNGRRVAFPYGRARCATNTG